MASTLLLQQPSSIAAVLREIEVARQRELALDTELAGLLKTRASLATQISTLATASEDVTAIHETTQRMAAKIHQSSVSAIALSSKVKELDTAQSRLRDALGRVGSVLDLKHTITAVERAIESKDYGTAAKKTFRVLYGSKPVETDTSYAALLTLQAKVRELVITECNVAESQEQWPTVLRLCRLFPTLGLAKRGIDKYCATVRRVFAAGLDADGISLKSFPAGAVIPFADVTTRLIERTAATLAAHSTIIQSEFGAGTHIVLIQQLQLECDKQFEPVLRRFTTEHKVLSHVQAVKAVKLQLTKPNPNANTAAANRAREAKEADARELDSLLDEIAFITHENESFDKNLRQLAAIAKQSVLDSKSDASRKALGLIPATASGAATNSADTKSPPPTGAAAVAAAASSSSALELIHVSKLNESVQELVGHYCALEEYFMFQNVQKAIHIDERESEQAQISTVIDDIFYILKKCTRRAFSTGSANSICTIVNHINKMLSENVRAVLEAMLADHVALNKNVTSFALPKGSGDSKFAGAAGAGAAGAAVGGGKPGGAGGAAGAKSGADSGPVPSDLFTVLNNMTLAASHIVTLQRYLLKQFDIGFTTHDMKRMIKHSLDEMTETAAILSKAARVGVTSLLSLMRSHVQPMIDEFVKTNYELGQSDYSDREPADQYVPRLIDGIAAELSVLKRRLTDSNYAYFIHSIAHLTVQRLESHVFRKRFTFWGGLQFDRDIRALSAFYANACVSSVRDKFTKLIQIASILQLEKPNEILESWKPQSAATATATAAAAAAAAAGGTAAAAAAVDDQLLWRLHANEVRQCLLLRVDFAPKIVNSLKL